MAGDLVALLRVHGDLKNPDCDAYVAVGLCDEAADEIELLRSEISRLRGLLETHK